MMLRGISKTILIQIEKESAYYFRLDGRHDRGCRRRTILKQLTPLRVQFSDCVIVLLTL